MIERTFESEARPALTIRIQTETVQGRTADMPNDVWWTMPWSNLPVFLLNPKLSDQLRRGFSWALEYHGKAET